MERFLQARVKADEERDRLLDLRVEAFRQRRQQKQQYLVFQHWTLLAAERVSNQNIACAKLQKVELQDQVRHCAMLGSLLASHCLQKKWLLTECMLLLTRLNCDCRELAASFYILQVYGVQNCSLNCCVM